MNGRIGGAQLSDSFDIMIPWELGVMRKMLSRRPLESLGNQATHRLGQCCTEADFKSVTVEVIHNRCPSTDNALSLHDQQYNALTHPTCNEQRPTAVANLCISTRSWLT